MAHGLMRVLLVGFGPFPGVPRNPSADLVKRLAKRRRPALASAIRTPHIFVTAYAAVDNELPKLLANKPDIILMFGLAARRRQLCIETQARNARSILFPDVRGTRPARGVIALGEPAARRGDARFARLLAAAQGSRMPARLSRDAGRYVCNYSYWQALDLAGRGSRPLVQFIHIPRVRLASHPKRKQKYRAPPFSLALAAAENLLIALMAARRQQRNR
jgi:pyroglutamyl-peptidase